MSEEAAALRARIGRLEAELDAARAGRENLAESLAGLEHSMSLYADFFDIAPVGFLALAADGRILQANRAACELLNNVKPFLIGCRIQDVLRPEGAWLMASLAARPAPGAGPVDIADWPPSREDLHAVAVTRADAKYRRIHLITFRSAALRDKHLRRSEFRLRAILDGIAEAIITVDADGLIDLYNPAAERMFECAAPRALGRAIAEVIPALARYDLDDVAASPWGVTIRAARNGAAHELLLTCHRVRSFDQSLMLLVARDRTEQRRLQRLMLEASEREQRRLGRDLHDGLSQQLAGVGYLARALQRRLAEQRLPAASEAQRVVELMDQTQEQVRSLSRTLYPPELERAGLTAALAVLVENLEKLSGVACSFHGAGEVEGADEEVNAHVYRIAQEAAANALRHGHPSRIRVELATASDRLVMNVSDDGAGFEPSTVPSGAGLGLRTMAERASLIGGQLAIESAPGRGTVVRCQAPAFAQGDFGGKRKRSPQGEV